MEAIKTFLTGAAFLSLALGFVALCFVFPPILLVAIFIGMSYWLGLVLREDDYPPMPYSVHPDYTWDKAVEYYRATGHNPVGCDVCIRGGIPPLPDGS